MSDNFDEDSCVPEDNLDYRKHEIVGYNEPAGTKENGRYNERNEVDIECLSLT
jgi:hypothetical protein